MCLILKILKNTLHLQQKIATRPIRVLKIGFYNSKLDCFVSSVFQKYYQKDKQYSLQFPKPHANDIDNTVYQEIYIQVGFHSYKWLPEYYLGKMAAYGWISKGNDNIFPETIAIFEIPKGAIYYSDGENHCVSDSIIFRKAIFNIKEWRAENFYSQTEKIL